MRYLIVDTHELANPRLGQFGRVLTEEEALAKFKEFYEAGKLTGEYLYDQSGMNLLRIEDIRLWDDLKVGLIGTTGELTVSKS